MIRGLFGSETTIGILRRGLDESSEVHRSIQDRLANARTPDAGQGFANALDAQMADATTTEGDILSDMVAMADNQVRYDTAAVLAQKAYAKFRMAIRGRG